jgi:hypothetical protein
VSVLPAAHLVHFYSTAEGLARSLSGFFAEPLKRGESVIVVARPEHRQAIDSALRDAGVDLTAEVRAGRYISRDVNETLDSFLVDDRPSREVFATLAPAMVQGAKRRTGNVHVYGEMIATLVGRGDVVGAMEFETMWGELVRESPFPLICGFPRETLEGDLAAVLEGVSSVHDAFLTTRSAGRRQPGAVLDVALGPGAVAVARRHVRDLLTGWGHADVESLDDTAVVVGELVGTAIRHGAERVALSVTSDADEVIVSVLDHLVDPAPPDEDDPADAGRSFAVLSGLTDGWGSERTPEGTRLWARLRPSPGAQARTSGAATRRGSPRPCASRRRRA